MRISVKTAIPLILGIALLVSLVAVSSGSGALAQSATSAATMSSGSSGTASAMTYPPCTPASSAMSTAMATQSTAMQATMMPTMMASQSATMSGSPGFLGISATTVDGCGILVAGLVTPGPAATAGLQVGDIIVAVNGQSVAAINTMNASAMGSGSATQAASGSSGVEMSIQPFATFIQSMQAGQTIMLTIQRNGQQMDISVTLGTIPSGLMTGTPGTGSSSGATMMPVASATVSQ